MINGKERLIAAVWRIWSQNGQTHGQTGIGGSCEVYCLCMFYNQPNCCKGLKVCMNGRIFSCQRGNEQCENSWAKSGGAQI